MKCLYLDISSEPCRQALVRLQWGGLFPWVNPPRFPKALGPFPGAPHTNAQPHSRQLRPQATERPGDWKRWWSAVGTAGRLELSAASRLGEDRLPSWGSTGWPQRPCASCPSDLEPRPGKDRHLGDGAAAWEAVSLFGVLVSMEMYGRQFK